MVIDIDLKACQLIWQAISDKNVFELFFLAYTVSNE